MLDAIDDFLAGGLHRGLGEEALAARNIEVANVIEDGMAFGFHVIKWFFRFGLTLAGLVARLDLVDDVDAAFAADDLAGRVTLLRGFDGGNNFHKRDENTVRPDLCQRQISPATNSIQTRIFRLVRQQLPLVVNLPQQIAPQLLIRRILQQIRHQRTDHPRVALHLFF